MQRITITLDDDLVEDFEKYLGDNGYQNRSEAIRDLIRQRMDEKKLTEKPSGNCLANLTYIFNHHERIEAALAAIYPARPDDPNRETRYLMPVKETGLEISRVLGSVEMANRMAASVYSATGSALAAAAEVTTMPRSNTSASIVASPRLAASR